MAKKEEKTKVVTEMGSRSAEDRLALTQDAGGSNPSSPEAPDFSEIQEKIKKGEIQIDFAPDLEIERVEIGGWLDKALELLGHPEALVTDWSTVWDFSPGGDEDKEWYNELEEKFGFEVKKSDHIWRLAERLKYENGG